MRDVVASAQSFESVTQEIGQPTPRYPSLRGRVAHWTMRVLGQVFWWYTWRLKEAFAQFSQKLHLQAQQHSRVTAFLIQAQIESATHLHELQKQIAELKRAVDAGVTGTEYQSINSMVVDLSSSFQNLRRRVDELHGDLLSKHGAVHASLANEGAAREALGAELANAISHFDPIRRRVEEAEPLCSTTSLQPHRPRGADFGSVVRSADVLIRSSDRPREGRSTRYQG